MKKLDLDELLDLNPHLDKDHFKNRRLKKSVVKKGTPEGGISSPYADRGTAEKPSQNWGLRSELEHRPHYRAT